MSAIIRSLNECCYLTPKFSFITSKRWNSNRTCVVKIGREIYTRMYPTVLVYPNGASVKIRYHEPRKIIKLPFDLNSLSPSEQMIRLKKRKPKEKMKIEEEIENPNIDIEKYLKISKNN